MPAACATRLALPALVAVKVQGKVCAPPPGRSAAGGDAPGVSSVLVCQDDATESAAESPRLRVSSETEKDWPTLTRAGREEHRHRQEYVSRPQRAEEDT